VYTVTKEEFLKTFMCFSESLQLLCEFAQLEAKDRKSWAVVVSPQIMTILDDCLG